MSAFLVGSSPGAFGERQDRGADVVGQVETRRTEGRRRARFARICA
jgi:hypothetical protein